MMTRERRIVTARDERMRIGSPTGAMNRRA
jgi:hypothetical protein